jgi:hypothetical protein
MKYAYIPSMVLFICLCTATGIEAQNLRPEGIEEQKEAERRPSIQPVNRASDRVSESQEASGGLMPGGIFDLLDIAFPGVGNSWHVLNGSYALVPGPGWYSNQYSGFLINSFRVSEGLWLCNGLFYSNYYTTRDRNFPERLQKLGEHIMLIGDRFTVNASVSSKSDILFHNFKSIDINAGANFRVWRSGPNSIRVGFIYSSRGELWTLALPLPTFAYRYATPTFIVSVGLPLFMAWRPNHTISLILAGLLPGVGRLQLRFKLHEYVSLGFQWTVRKEIFYLNAYPFRGYNDLHYLTYSLRELLNYGDEREEDKKFVLSGSRAGITLSFNIQHHASIFIFNGLQFGASYYLTNNIVARSKHPYRLGNFYVFEFGARGFLYFSDLSD